jgi:hypothetical protein
MPVALSASELALIHHAAAPLERNRQDAFTKAVLGALEGVPEVGQAIRSLQRQFWDPPQTAKGTVTHCISRSKLRSGPAVA